MPANLESGMQEEVEVEGGVAVVLSEVPARIQVQARADPVQVAKA